MWHNVSNYCTSRFFRCLMPFHMQLQITKPAAPQLSDREVRRGLRLNIMSGCLGMFWVAIALNMPYTMLLDALGANGMLQGLSSTILQLTLAIQIPGALFFEMLQRRKSVWGGLAIAHRLCWFIPAYLAWLHPAAPFGAHMVVFVATFSIGLGNFSASAWHSWLADLVPEQTRGQFWSTRQAFTMVAFLLAMAMSGIVLDHIKPTDPDGPMTGFAIVFGIAALLGTIDIVIHLGVPEPAVRRTIRNLSLVDRLIEPLRLPNFRRLAIAMGLWMFSCTLVGSFAQLYARRVLHATYTELSIWTIMASLSTILAGLSAGHLIDRIGARAFGAVMILIAPVFGACWFLVTDTPLRLHVPLLGELQTSWGMALVTITSFLSAGLYSCVGLSHMSLLAATAPERGRTLAMAVQWTVIGLLGAGGSIVGGYVMDLFPRNGSHFLLLRNTHFHFIHALIILHILTAWFVVLPVFLGLRVRRERLSMVEAFNRIVLVNPLRFASGIYHARVMSSPVTRHRRALAVEAAGDSGAEVFVTDLATRLTDASAEVREAAAQSLGQIGNRDARDALIKALQDPASDLAVHILRALRRCALAEDAPVILSRLQDENLEIVREAARTLGSTGANEAVQPLLDLLQTTRHESIAMAAAEALARLHNIAAIYAILPHMRTTNSLVARRTFAFAAGDLLGEPDGFYRTLTVEDQSHGAGITPLIQRLCTNWRRVEAGDPTTHAQQAAALIGALDRHYEAREKRAAASTALRIALLFSEHCCNVSNTGDIHEFLTVLREMDPRIAAGVWYLALLDGSIQMPSQTPSVPEPELVEIQLAIYMLSCWIKDA